MYSYGQIMKDGRIYSTWDAYLEQCRAYNFVPLPREIWESWQKDLQNKDGRKRFYD